jgi:hypothetical protein
MWDVSLVALSPGAVRWVSLAAKGAVVGLLMWCVRGGRARRPSPAEASFCALGETGAIVSAMLLLSPMSSVQHFCVLLAPICFAVTDFVYRRRDPWVGAGLALSALNGLACGDLVGRNVHLQLQSYGHLTWAALVHMALCGYILRARAASRAADAASADETGSDRSAPPISLPVASEPVAKTA